jgi:hypothetical protein
MKQGCILEFTEQLPALHGNLAPVWQIMKWVAWFPLSIFVTLPDI